MCTHMILFMWLNPPRPMCVCGSTMTDQHVEGAHGDFGVVALFRCWVPSSMDESSSSNLYWLNLAMAVFTRRSLVEYIC